MVEKKTAQKTTRRPAKRTPAATKKHEGFTADERAAMKERARELKAAAAGADGEREVLAKIAEMPAPDRAMATRLHEIVKGSAPNLSARTWYGMPAYTKDGKVVCFFKAASKFDSRYATFGFEEMANLDAFALTKLTPADEKKIASLVKKAAR